MKVTIDGSGKTLNVWVLPGKRVAISLTDGDSSLQLQLSTLEANVLGAILLEHAKG